MNTAYINIQHFFHMGGYGVYVWSAYCCFFIVLLMNIILPLKHFHYTKKKLSMRFVSNDSKSLQLE